MAHKGLDCSPQTSAQSPLPYHFSCNCTWNLQAPSSSFHVLHLPKGTVKNSMTWYEELRVRMDHDGYRAGVVEMSMQVLVEMVAVPMQSHCSGEGGGACVGNAVQLERRELQVPATVE